MNLADYIKTELPKWPNWITVPLLKINIFGPLVYGRSYLRWRKKINDIDPEQQLLSVVNHAIRHVPYYRRRYPGLEVHSLHEFETKIGFIDKDEVMAHWEEFIADGTDLSLCSVGTTGGTSGKPMKLVNSRNRYAVELAFMHRLWHKTGWNYHTRGVIRNHKIPQGKDFEVNPFTKEIIFDAFRIDTSYVRTIVNILKKYHIRYIQAYPSAAYQFCKLCKSAVLDISFIKYFLCGSEAVTHAQRYFIEKEMGIGVFSWYGHSEKLILGGDNGKGSLIIEPQYGYFELIDKDNLIISQPSIEGEMVGTTFYNRIMPLIRYKTGDSSSYTTKRDDMKSPALIGPVSGHREKNLIYKADGTTTSTTALNLHNDAYEHIDGLQYIQNHRGELDVCIIKGNGYTKETEIFIYNHIKNAMGKQAIVNIKYVEKLTFLPNGKFLPLISNIK